MSLTFVVEMRHSINSYQMDRHEVQTFMSPIGNFGALLTPHLAQFVGQNCNLSSAFLYDQNTC